MTRVIDSSSYPLEDAPVRRARRSSGMPMMLLRGDGDAATFRRRRPAPERGFARLRRGTEILIACPNPSACGLWQVRIGELALLRGRLDPGQLAIARTMPILGFAWPAALKMRRLTTGASARRSRIRRSRGGECCERTQYDAACSRGSEGGSPARRFRTTRSAPVCSARSAGCHAFASGSTNSAWYSSARAAARKSATQRKRLIATTISMPATINVILLA